jgi:hypothetical protein
MTEYKQFVDKLQTDLQSFLSTPKENWKDLAAKNVDGLASEELRRLINIETRRDFGAFFTNSKLAKQVFSNLKPRFNNESIIYDCACGAGNLLISVMDVLYKSDCASDLEKRLLGTDIHHEFVEAAQLRLFINRLLEQDILPHIGNNERPFASKIIVGDGLENNSFYQKATNIVINPPFNLITPNCELSWSKGKVSAAALFMDRVIQYTNPGVSIIAILPDVLRSGSRYEKWRSLVIKECNIEKVKLLGQFDKHADVDVFALKLTKRKKAISIGTNTTLKTYETKTNQVVEDLFDVKVGPVVDNRDPHQGRLLQYVVSKGLEGWSEQKKIEQKRRHKGKCFEGPFVVVKRTSRMGDSHRAIASIINIPKQVFVDNHLIILRPKSGKLKDCHLLLSLLRNKKTDDWLNHQIRCRHLTVKIVSKIPVWQ